MKHEQDRIREFMEQAKQELPSSPTMPSLKVRIGRVKWIAEELCELANAYGLDIDVNNVGCTSGNISVTEAPTPMFKEQDSTEAITEAYDALLDINVFTLGTGLAMGVDLTPGFEEVMDSNMSKFRPGYYVREDGKLMKSPLWEPPKLQPIIEAQIAAAASKAQ